MRKALSVVFVLALLGAIGACKKDGEAPAAPAKEPAAKEEPKAAPAAAEPKAAEPKAAEPKAEPAAEDKPAEPAAAGGGAGWPEVCNKVKACAAAWAAEGPAGAYKEVVVEGWKGLEPAINAAPAEFELGCKTALESWGSFEGAPGACK